MRATPEAAEPRAVLRSAALVGLLIAAGLAALRFGNAEPAERGVESFRALAIGLPYAAPAVLALLGLRGRPALLLAGGLLGVVLALTGLSVVGLVLLVPSVAYLVGAVRVRSGWPGAARAGSVLLVSLVLGVGSLLLLFLRDDPVCWALVPSAAGPASVRLLPPARFVRGTTVGISSRDLPRGATAAGCSSDTISTVEVLASSAAVSLTLGAAWRLAAPAAYREPSPA